MKEEVENHRNEIVQIIINKDGTRSKIYHKKKFQGSEYGDRIEWWRGVNRMKKENPRRRNQGRWRIIEATER